MYNPTDLNGGGYILSNFKNYGSIKIKDPQNNQVAASIDKYKKSKSHLGARLAHSCHADRLSEGLCSLLVFGFHLLIYAQASPDQGSTSCLATSATWSCTRTPPGPRKALPRRDRCPDQVSRAKATSRGR